MTAATGPRAAHLYATASAFTRARDGYLDALFEVNQAQADLAAAVGDPALALNPGTPRP